MDKENSKEKSSKQVTVAVVGATGVVGKEVIKLLEERQFPAKQLRLLASKKSKGTKNYSGFKDFWYG